MGKPLLVLVGTQVLFTTGDLIARFNMRRQSFHISTFFSLWFLLYFLIRQVAMFGQLYVFSEVKLGRTMALFGAVSIIFSNTVGVLLLKEVLPLSAYVGVSFAVLAFLVLALAKV